VRPRGRVDDRRDVRTLTGDPDQTVRLTVVADDGDDDVSVEVEVEFDGETQTVDARTGDRTPGAFASLYDLGDGTQVTCEGVRPSGAPPSRRAARWCSTCRTSPGTAGPRPAGPSSS
jgi:hypothetical protein